MPTKGRDISVREKRGRSPMLPRKVEITRTINAPPSTPERKDVEPRKIPIYDKHTVSSSMYARSVIKQPFVVNTKLVPQSKVMSLRSKFNEKRFTNLYPNTTGSSKTEDARKPPIVHGKKLTKPPADDLGSTTIAVAKSPMLFDDDHNVVTHVAHEDHNDHKTTPFEDTDVPTLEKCNEPRMDLEDGDHISEDGDEPSVPTSYEGTSTEHMDDEGNNEPPRFKGEKKDEGVEVRSKDGDTDGDGVEETGDGMEVQEIKEEGGEKVPKEEDGGSNEVVSHGKMDTAACKRVIEVTLSELQQQRLNRVKALIGAFETIISLESCDVLQKSLIKQC